jgi:hypothetical protein
MAPCARCAGLCSRGRAEAHTASCGGFSCVHVLARLSDACTAHASGRGVDSSSSEHVACLLRRCARCCWPAHLVVRQQPQSHVHPHKHLLAELAAPPPTPATHYDHHHRRSDVSAGGGAASQLRAQRPGVPWARTADQKPCAGGCGCAHTLTCDRLRPPHPHTPATVVRRCMLAPKGVPTTTHAAPRGTGTAVARYHPAAQHRAAAARPAQAMTPGACGTGCRYTRPSSEHSRCVRVR